MTNDERYRDRHVDDVVDGDTDQLQQAPIVVIFASSARSNISRAVFVACQYSHMIDSFTSRNRFDAANTSTHTHNDR